MKWYGGDCARVYGTKALALAVCASAMMVATGAVAQVSVNHVEGNGPYDPVTLDLTGPTLSEGSGPNPFADYRLDVTFSNGERQWTVPGYFAGCADAADRDCEGGDLWRVHFLPNASGAWNYSISFTTGTDVAATGTGGQAVDLLDGLSGEFSVNATPRDDLRARGYLTYTGETYYRWAGNGEPSFKVGPDAPENMLAYADFTGTPNTNGLLKTWSPHLSDYDPATGDAYTWAGGQGRGMLGMFNYLHQSGLNVVSMLLFNVGGDDGNVVPQLMRVDADTYARMGERGNRNSTRSNNAPAQWEQGVHHDRYDLSRLAQWQRALSYADSLGLRLHFKVQETENDRFMDGGAVGRERRIYLREMIARFNHYLGVTWNMGEENVQDTQHMAEQTRYFAALEPYGRPLVLHTYPTHKERYRPLLGEGSALNGLSIQGLNDTFHDVRYDVVRWSALSRLNGRAWVMAYDEPGSAQGGSGIDADYPADRLPAPLELNVPREDYRRLVFWNTLTAGGEGVEVYYGYQSGCTDLNCEDHRTRHALYGDGRRARQFFEEHVGRDALTMGAEDGLTEDESDFVFADPGRLYVVYTSSGQPVRLDMLGQAGRYSVGWYDALAGGPLQNGALAEFEIDIASFVSGRYGFIDLGQPPSGSGDWAVLVRRVD